MRQGGPQQYFRKLLTRLIRRPIDERSHPWVGRGSVWEAIIQKVLVPDVLVVEAPLQAILAAADESYEPIQQDTHRCPEPRLFVVQRLCHIGLQSVGQVISVPINEPVSINVCLLRIG